MKQTFHGRQIPRHSALQRLGRAAAHRVRHARPRSACSGSVPRDLNGTLYRCGPDRQYPPMTADDIFIDGEGMVHMFHFEDGHVDYRSRWVRNERFLLQEAARRSLFGRYRNRYTERSERRGQEPAARRTRTSCGTASELLVLKEDSLPVEAGSR